MQNSMMLFTFFFFGRKCPFRANLVQKIKIVSLRWNLIPRLIRICRIQWCNLPFRANLVQNVKIVSFRLNLVASLIWICRIQWYCPLFFFDQKYHFRANFVQNVKIISLSWNLVPRLIWICKIQWCCWLCFRLEIPFLGKFGPKYQNRQFKVNFDI